MIRHFAAIAGLLAISVAIRGLSSAGPAIPERPGVTSRTLTVAVEAGRVREGPSLDSRILFRVQKGDSLNLLEEKDDWRRVALRDGQSGWVHRSLFTEAAQSAAMPSGRGGEIHKILIVRVDVALVREQVSTDSRIIYRLKRGTIVSANRTVSGWYQIPLPDGRTGWAHKDLFTEN